MNKFELFDIAERHMNVLNPSNSEKILRAGRMAGLKPGDRLIDFGCGFGETMVMWHKEFGVTGVGIDIREYACERAEARLKEVGLADRFEIVCINGAEYEFEKGRYDVAACLGSTFVWGVFRDAIRAMKPAVRPGGKLVIGEVYWKTENISQKYLDTTAPPGILSDHELLDVLLEEGCELEDIIRSDETDWDAYYSAEWRGLQSWLEENPDHPDFEEVKTHLHSVQKEYLQYERPYLGWAMYVLKPGCSQS